MLLNPRKDPMTSRFPAISRTNEPTFFLGCWLFFALLFPPLAHADLKQCVTHFKQKQFLASGECFAALLKQQKPTRFKKAMYLWNGALAFRKAAQSEQNAEKSGYIKERATLLLDQFVRGQYYRTPTQRNLALKVLSQLKQQIGYALLSIQTPHPKAIIRVQGYSFSHSSEGSWEQQVRPGTYTIEVNTPEGGQLQRQITIEPNQPQRLKLSVPTKNTPQQPRREIPPPRRLVAKPPPPRVISTPPEKIKLILWNPVKPPPRAATMVAGLIAGGGVALMIAGGVVMLLNIDLIQRSDKIQADAQKDFNFTPPGPYAQWYQALQEENTRNWIVGGTLATIGAATLALGITIYALSHQNAAPPVVTSQLTKVPHPLARSTPPASASLLLAH